MRWPGIRANWAFSRRRGADKGIEILEEEGYLTGNHERDALSS